MARGVACGVECGVARGVAYGVVWGVLKGARGIRGVELLLLLGLLSAPHGVTLAVRGVP